MSKNRNRRLRIKRRIRKTINGTAARPRLTVFRSNKQIYAQIINDDEGVTMVSADSRAITDKATSKEIAAQVGELIAQRAKDAGIETVVFDRNGYLYHGRVKELADAARNTGLVF
ncbi:MAG: 50S ribosomal protein L18 [Porphyromonas sp.]|nr:50S ribosomal protein L18 [Porphyromonas sp.]